MHAWQKLGLLGEDPILQFVNTVDDIGKTRRDDGVPDWATLMMWAEAAGVLSGEGAESLQRRAGDPQAYEEVRAVHDLREATWCILRPAGADDECYASAAAVVTQGVRWSFDRAEFRSEEGDFRWRVRTGGSSLTLLRVRLGLGVERFLRSAERERVKECGRCTALFLDRGRGRSRVWCRMSTCGNRAKVDRFRSKQ